MNPTDLDPVAISMKHNLPTLALSDRTMHYPKLVCSNPGRDLAKTYK